MLDCASAAFWWPVCVFALAATVAMLGIHVSDYWLALAFGVAWLLGTIIYFLRARTRVLDAARWLDRVTDSQELFVSAASLLGQTKPNSAAAHYLLNAAQKRLPTARVRSAALIGWKIPKQTGIALTIGITCFVALHLAERKGSNLSTPFQESPAIGEAVASQIGAPTAHTEPTRPGLASRLAESLKISDSALREQEKAHQNNALSSVPQADRGDALVSDDKARKFLNALIQSAMPALVPNRTTNNSSTQNSFISTPKGTGNGRQAGDEKGENKTDLAGDQALATAKNSQFFNLGIKAESAIYAQDRVGKPLAPVESTRQSKQLLAANARPARPENTPLPPSFGPQQRNLITRYFHELDRAN